VVDELAAGNRVKHARTSARTQTTDVKAYVTSPAFTKLGSAAAAGKADARR